MRRASTSAGGGGAGYSDRYRRATGLPGTAGRAMSSAGSEKVNRSRSLVSKQDRRVSTRAEPSLPPGMSFRKDSSPAKKKPAALKLSGVLTRKVLAAGADKLSFVEKGVTEIDRVPELQRCTQILFASGNLLRSLSGVEHFANLRILSAASNYMSGFEAVECLGQLPRLETLSLQNNLLTQLPFYRLHMIDLCRALRNLDGREVGKKERELAPGAIERERRDLRVMYAQHCLVWKLRGACGKVGLLGELRSVWATRGMVQRPEVVSLEKYLVSSAELLVWYFTRQDVEAVIRKTVRRTRMLKMNSAPHESKDFDSVTGWETAYVSVFNDQNVAINHALHQLEDAVAAAHGIEVHTLQDDSLVDTFKELCLQLTDKAERGELLASWKPRARPSSAHLPPQQTDPHGGTLYDMSVLSTTSSVPHDPRTERQKLATAQHAKRMAGGSATSAPGPLLPRTSSAPASEDLGRGLDSYVFAPELSPENSPTRSRQPRVLSAVGSRIGQGEETMDNDILAGVPHTKCPGTVPVTPLDSEQSVRSQDLEKIHGMMTMAEMDVRAGARASHFPQGDGAGAGLQSHASQASLGRPDSQGQLAQSRVSDEVKLQQVNEALREKLVEFQTSHEKASKAAKQYKQQLQDSRQEAQDSEAAHETAMGALAAKHRAAEETIAALQTQLAAASDAKQRSAAELTSELDATRSILSQRGKDAEKARRDSDARCDELQAAFDAQARELALARDTIGALQSETSYLNSKLVQYKQEIQTHRSIQRQQRGASVSNSSVQTSCDVGSVADDELEWGSVDSEVHRAAIQAMGDRALLRRALRRFKGSVEPLIRRRDGCSLLDDVMRIQHIRDVMKRWKRLAHQDAFVVRGEERRRRRVLRDGLYLLYRYSAGEGRAAPPSQPRTDPRAQRQAEATFSPTPQPTSRQPKAWGAEPWSRTEHGRDLKAPQRYDDDADDSDAGCDSPTQAPRARTRSPLPHEEARAGRGVPPPPRATAQHKKPQTRRHEAAPDPPPQEDAAIRPRPSRRRDGGARAVGKAYPVEGGEDDRMRVVPCAGARSHGAYVPVLRRTAGNYDRMQGGRGVRICADPNQADALSSSDEGHPAPREYDEAASQGRTASGSSGCDYITPDKAPAHPSTSAVRYVQLHEGLAEHFSAWRRTARRQHLAAHQKQLAAQLRRVRDAKLRDGAMRQWLQKYRHRALLGRLEEAAYERRAEACTRAAFSKWKTAGMRALAKYKAQQGKLLSEIEAQKERVSTLGLSNMRLVDSLSEAVEKAATLEVEVEGKETALQDLTKTLNSCRATGKALRCRLQGVMSTRDESRAQIKVLSQGALDDEERLTEYKTKQLLLESANARQVHELNSELEDAKAGLNTLYEQLRGTQAELEQAHETGVTATQAMMAMTTQLRERVTQQEATIASLELERRQQDEAQDLFQKDLVAAKRRIADEQSRRGAAIRAQQEKMHEMQQVAKRSEVALAMQKSESHGQVMELKRLQHEVRLMQAREAGVGTGGEVSTPSDCALQMHPEPGLQRAQSPTPSAPTAPNPALSTTGNNENENENDDNLLASQSVVEGALEGGLYMDTSGEVEELLKRARKAKEQLSLRESRLRRQGAELLMRATSPVRHLTIQPSGDTRDGSDTS